MTVVQGERMETGPDGADRIAFLGFGEAAQAFLRGWRTQPGFAARIAAYDVKTDSPDARVRDAKRADYSAAQVEDGETAPAALAGAPLIFSVVTADQAEAAALAALPGLAENAFFFDCNSCAPQTKARVAVRIEAAGGRYVDTAVMAPVHPRLHRTPLLISGPHAEAAAAALRSLAMAPEIHAGPVGSSSSVKMIRSVMIKGLEALACECALAGRAAGVDDVVLATLDDTFPGFDWKKRIAYMMERVMTHGVRRAAEMREVALTVDELGLDGAMSRGAVAWQQRVGELRLRAADGDPSDYRDLADRILSALASHGETK
jgi:3-hydroxyisobutyrate dehydrogenase-like beta-hydroxyacid dehydrogenase